MFTTSFTLALNFTPKPLTVGLALVTMSVCVSVCVCVCEKERDIDRERQREWAYIACGQRTIYFFRRNINNVHAKTAAKEEEAQYRL